MCRYHHSSACFATQCDECATAHGLWVCLLCGFVGCGEGNIAGDSMSAMSDGHARARGHAYGHYAETLHAYALEISSRLVWDFAGGGSEASRAPAPLRCPGALGARRLNVCCARFSLAGTSIA